VHRLGAYLGFAAGLLICTVLASSPQLELASAHAQNVAERKKATTSNRKVSPRVPKDAQKDQARTPFTEQDEQAAIIPGIADARVWGDSEKEFSRLLPQASGPWLAISGGGSDGAYGAGVLTGWTETGTRPEFAAVTGASIGSLLAPFAFLGPRYDEEVRKTFTLISAADIFEDRKTRDSLFDHWPLKRQVEMRVTAQLVADVAAEHARGRRLFVVTTNLDAGRRVVWNMGAIAARGDDKALELFRDILLASCSIPGFFSPVGIDVEADGKKFEELHSDGTITAPFFVVPETMMAAGSTSRPPLDQLYVIVNSRLGHDFSMPDRSIHGVLGRSITVALTSAMRLQLLLISGGAQRHGFGLRIARVNESFSHPQRGAFDGAYMRALYEHGVASGKKGTAFEDGSTVLFQRTLSTAQ
jgi:Patatin-like phospholipase